MLARLSMLQNSKSVNTNKQATKQNAYAFAMRKTMIHKSRHQNLLPPFILSFCARALNNYHSRQNGNGEKNEIVNCSAATIWSVCVCMLIYASE